jgi:hypothetical protein
MLFDDNFAGLAMFALMGLMFASYKLGELMAEYRHELEATRRRHATMKRKTNRWYLQEINNRKGN